jgi:single-strand selective monofunctional uracil DNA glycosylase
MKLVEVSRDLSAAMRKLNFGPPVTHVYAPLEYAGELHAAYLQKYGTGRKEVLLLGMNPGPFGMAQTGVPFGDVAMVRDWLGLSGAVGRPRVEHPKRPVRGLDCPRSEVSGARLWGWARDRFGTPDRFFEQFFVMNYCPLAFIEESGRNRPPDKLPALEQRPLFDACDRALARAVDLLRPTLVVGIGAFAKDRARLVLEGKPITVGTILHPSPASPLANRGWAPAIEVQLTAMGVTLPDGPGKTLK